jgi:Polyketide cyclase / dehydrase and lipid transport
VKTVQTKIETTRAPDEVYEYLVDFANHPDWRFDVLESELVKGETGRVGARYRQRVKQGRREMTVQSELTQAEPPRTIAFRTVDSGPITASGTYEIRATADGTRRGRRRRRSARLHACVRADDGADAAEDRRAIRAGSCAPPGGGAAGSVAWARATRRCSVCWSIDERRELEEMERKLQEDEARRIQQVAREPEERRETEIEEERELVRS